MLVALFVAVVVSFSLLVFPVFVSESLLYFSHTIHVHTGWISVRHDENWFMSRWFVYIYRLLGQS